MVEVTLLTVPRLFDLPDDIEPRDDQLLGKSSEQLIELAGRICYDSLGKGRSSQDYHEHILDVGHSSVLEHAQFSFLVRNVSRGLTHELVRHRVGIAISQRSTRFVDESEAAYCIHPALRKFLADPDVPWTTKARIQSKIAVAMETARDAYRDITQELEPYLVKQEMEKTSARKQARGAARGFLGNGIETELVWSANVRTLLHVLKMRGDVAADGEIREFAAALFECIRDQVPAYFSKIEMVVGTPDGAPILLNVPSI